MKNKIANIGLNIYNPEMGQKKPISQIEATMAYSSQHWYLDTPLTLKGRGIKFIKKYTADELVGGETNRKLGWNSYKATYAAFEKLKTQYAIGKEALFD